jgi:hypothetical protein
VLATPACCPVLQDPLPPGVVEFGEAEDEPDYAALLNRKQQQQQQQGTGRSGASGKQSGGSAGQKQKAQLVQHKTGDMTHAEPNVPAASRLQLFGPESVPGVADDSSWAGLGLSSVLSAHLEALNFQEPTQVRVVQAAAAFAPVSVAASAFGASLPLSLHPASFDTRRTPHRCRSRPFLCC